jgi:hypothetical protein
MPIYLGMDREQDIPFVVENGIIKPEQAIRLHDGDRGTLRMTDPATTNEKKHIDRGEFWKNKSVAELAAEQQVKPGARLSDLRGDWPADESIDEFLAEVRRWRQ